MLVFDERGKPEFLGKTSRSRLSNQQTQHPFVAESNLGHIALAEDKSCITHCSNPAYSPVLDPLSCHATLGREGSRIICVRMLALNQLYHTLCQHVCFTTKSQKWRENYSSTLQGKMSVNEVTTPKKHVKPSLENCKVCGITTQINARAVISNPSGKTNLGKNFQAYCKYGIVFRKDSPVLFT